MKSLFQQRNLFFAICMVFSLGFIYTSCSSEPQTEEVEIPTEGLITTVKETQKDLFKIEDEVTVADTADSRIIAIYLDNKIDTFTLQEARLIQAYAGNSSAGSAVRSAGMGYFGFIMLGRMGAMPRAGAYSSAAAYNRVNQKAGSSMKSSANRVTRTRPRGKSGYGSGKSTRSYGG